jgi:hypothetical protein
MRRMHKINDRISYLALHIPLLPGKVVLDTGTIEFPRGILVQLGDLSVVSDGRTMLDCGHGERHVHARVVVLTWE